MCYDLPTTKNTRTCGFGIGSRFKNSMQVRKSKFLINFNNSFILYFILASPDPGIYQLKSDFDMGKPSTANTAKGGTKSGVYTFGISRDKYEKVYLPEDPRLAANFS